MNCFQCPCGELGYCTDQSEVCNCAGSPSKRTDTGKLSSRNFTLPIKEIKIQPGSGNVLVKVGAVKCAPRLFGKTLRKLAHAIYRDFFQL